MPITVQEFEEPDKHGLKTIFTNDPDHAYSEEEILQMRAQEQVKEHPWATVSRLRHMVKTGFLLSDLPPDIPTFGMLPRYYILNYNR